MPLAFVTGANGAIGRHCVSHLRRSGWAVGGLGHGSVQWEGAQGIDHWIAGDVSSENLDLIAERLGAPELIINLAGGSSVGASLQAPLGDFERTVLASTRILNWIQKNAPAAKFVGASSAAVYGDGYDAPIAETAALVPLSPYGFHKRMMEDSLRFWGTTFGLSTAVVRLFSVYGPGLRKQLVHDICTRLAASPDELVLSGTGRETRDWLWIEDAARLMVDIAPLASPSAPVFNGCTGHGTAIAEVAETLAKISDTGASIRFDGVSRAGDPRHLVGDVGRLAGTGFKASVSLTDGLERTYRSYAAKRSARA